MGLLRSQAQVLGMGFASSVISPEPPMSTLPASQSKRHP